MAGIVVGAAVFVAALAVPLGDPASLLLPLVMALRGGRLALDTEAATVADAPPTPGGSVTSTVLVVDDRPDARYSMGRPLATAGFDVRETATGRDALRLARIGVNVIVLDLVLPDLDGYEVLRRLKSDPATKDIPVILKTAFRSEEGHRQRGLDAGAADYFAEPFDT
jgi:CheY-like chemotaxis protein